MLVHHVLAGHLQNRASVSIQISLNHIKFNVDPQVRLGAEVDITNGRKEFLSKEKVRKKRKVKLRSAFREGDNQVEVVNHSVSVRGNKQDVEGVGSIFRHLEHVGQGQVVAVVPLALPASIQGIPGTELKHSLKGGGSEVAAEKIEKNEKFDLAAFVKK